MFKSFICIVFVIFLGLSLLVPNSQAATKSSVCTKIQYNYLYAKHSVKKITKDYKAATNEVDFLFDNLPEAMSLLRDAKQNLNQKNSSLDQTRALYRKGSATSAQLDKAIEAVKIAEENFYDYFEHYKVVSDGIKIFQKRADKIRPDLRKAQARLESITIKAAANRCSL